MSSRGVLPELHARIEAAGGSSVRQRCRADDLDGIVIDCRGLSALTATGAARQGLR